MQGAFPVYGEILPLTNQSFEDDAIGGNEFLNTTPSGWQRKMPDGRIVGLIGENRTLVANTAAGTTWAHLQTTSGAPADPPGIGQAIGALADGVFSDPSQSKLWIHCLASRRLNETTEIHVTASVYAAPAGATDWTSGTLIDSVTVATNLTNLTDGDPGSVAALAFKLDLDHASAQAAHPGGNYWIVLSNTMHSAGQLQLDWINAQTGDTTDPGPIDFPPDPPISAADLVHGNLILLNDNGGWCWYQDERALVDRDSGDLVIASVANYLGYGGEPRDGDMDVTTFSQTTGKRTLVTLGTVPTLNKGDDHNVAALWQRPDGRYLAKHTGHNYGAGYNDTVDWGDDNVPRSFWRITTNPNDGSSWEAEQAFTWPENGSGDDDVTYTNMHFMSAEGTGQGRLYNIARADDRTPHIAYSDDQGATWTYGGKLSTTTTGNSYSNGYFVFSGNGVDRIDFMCTEHHPYDYNNSIYHGYIQGGKSYDSFGNVVDANIFDQSAPAPQNFTPVWTTSAVSSTSLHHAWTMELEWINGTPYGLFTTRYGTAATGGQSGDADHRLFYARFDGVAWQTTQLCKMGDGLHAGQNDYTGLGSIHPNDPSTIYISSEFDPRDDTALPKHEIFKGVTNDQGASWSWTPVTENSTVENLRPIVPRWQDGYTAVLWLRGRYPHQRDYDESPVGIIDRPDQEVGMVTYHDASQTNTTLANGSPLTFTGPDSNDGSADGQWHLHTGLGNGTTAYTANESGSENAPAIKTTLTGLADGSYDVFAYFWSMPGDDWRTRAGFSTSDMLVFRRYSCQQAETSQFDAPVTVRDDQQALYRAYIGRRVVSAGSAITVYVDDFDGAAAAGTERSVYDGLGVAPVLPVLHVAAGETVTLSSADGPFASIHNEGTLIVKGSADLSVSGSFTNDGLLDLLVYNGAVPSGLVNHGSVLDATNADLTVAITLQEEGHTVTLGGYAGHSYQLQSSTSLMPGSWEDVGDPVAGTGVNGHAEPIEIPQPNPATALFYRFVID
ncbi:MAG: hypothetical protein H7A51_14470 [Akkermansiaceae bacterium]|nr:hypothetical protein [Akkermansiaceae bacterium]